MIDIKRDDQPHLYRSFIDRDQRADRAILPLQVKDCDASIFEWRKLWREAIYSRRAVRDFTTELVDEKALRQLIDAAIQAPSAVNQQPWSFSVVRDKALLARISREAKVHMLRTSPAALASHHFQELLSNPEFDIFYHAPALIVISAVAESPWAVEDCSLAAENLMLAASAAGLGTCWIGFAQAWLGTPEGKAALKLPETCVPVAPIIVGHPKSPAPAVPRKIPTVNWTL